MTVFSTNLQFALMQLRSVASLNKTHINVSFIRVNRSDTDFWGILKTQLWRLLIQSW